MLSALRPDPERLLVITAAHTMHESPPCERRCAAQLCRECTHNSMSRTSTCLFVTPTGRWLPKSQVPERSIQIASVFWAAVLARSRGDPDKARQHASEVTTAMLNARLGARTLAVLRLVPSPGAARRMPCAQAAGHVDRWRFGDVSASPALATWAAPSASHAPAPAG